MSQYTGQSKSQKPMIKVKVHSPKSLSTPRILSTSPDMIPAFDYGQYVSDDVGFNGLKEQKLLEDRKSTVLLKHHKNKSVGHAKGKSKSVKVHSSDQKVVDKNISITQKIQQPKIPLPLHKLKPRRATKLLTSTDVTRSSTKEHSQHRKVISAKDCKLNDNNSDLFKVMLNSEFPPYNPAHFAPDNYCSDDNHQSKGHSTDTHSQLVAQIQQELSEWEETCGNTCKGACLEQCNAKATRNEGETLARPNDTPTRILEEIGAGRKTGLTSEAAIQTSPVAEQQNHTLNTSLLAHTVQGKYQSPKIPSPLQKSTLLGEADQLLFKAERKLNLAEQKLLSASTARSLTECSQLTSARKNMNDLQSAHSKSSSLPTSSNNTYQVPQNSLASSSTFKDSEKYTKVNGENKILKSKVCNHEISTKSSSKQVEESKTYSYLNAKDGISKCYASPYLNVTNEHSTWKATQNRQDSDNSSKTNFKTNNNVFLNDVLTLKDVETNTGVEDCISLRRTSNSALINIKSSKQEVQDIIGSHKPLNIVKMPTVNIRPELTIHKGPKINIVPPSDTINKPQRQNTDYFDIVYPPYDTTSKLSEGVNFVCDRHVFPSGRLISGMEGDTLRVLVDDISLQGNKEILLGLIKLVSDKINEEQGIKGKSCCRLVCSLPLLASVVNKVEVECVKCVEQFYRKINILIQLMKEELRSCKPFSEGYCCQLDETVQYQIVELELLLDENFKEQNSEVQVFKQKDANEICRLPKKTVSFDNVNPDSKNAIHFEYGNQGIKSDIRKVISNKTRTSSYQTNEKIKVNKSFTQNKIISAKVNVQKNKVQDVPVTSSMARNTNNNCINNIQVNKRENTIVAQAISNISSRRVILKKGTFGPEKSEKDGTGPQTVSSFEDKRETSRELDDWIKERSLKIQNIHDELNNILCKSMENYLVAEHGTNNKETLQTINNKDVDDVADKCNQENINIIGYDYLEVPKETEAERIWGHAEDVTLYMDDFEEDLEENDEVKEDGKRYIEVCSNNIDEGGPTEDDPGKTVAEAKNNSCLSSRSSEMGENQEFETLTTVNKESLEVIQGNNCSAKYTSGSNNVLNNSKSTNSYTFKSSSAENKINVTSQDQHTSEEKPLSQELKKVDTATSPIGITREHNLLKLKDVLSNKTDAATSPISSVTPNVKYRHVTTMVQIEDLMKLVNSDSESQSKLHIQNHLLTVPSLKLTPKPVENVLKLSSEKACECSVGLNSNITNQGNKLFDIPEHLIQEKVEIKKTVVETKNSESQGREKQHLHSTVDGEHLSSALYHPGFNFKIVNESCSNHKTSNERLVNDIIEPTVAEVLKKMCKTNIISNSQEKTSSNDNEKGIEIQKSNSNRHMLHPNSSLQTCHRMCNGRDTPGLSDVDDKKQAVDCWNQTEIQKQDFCVQVSHNLAVNQHDKLNFGEVLSNCEKGYLEMLQSPHNKCYDLPSSVSDTHSSIIQSSYVSTSCSTSLSCRKDSDNLDEDKLSDGEVIPETCKCLAGTVCSTCVPKLDLSFGELKTKPKANKTITMSLHDANNLLSRVPLTLEPQPVGLTMSSRGHYQFKMYPAHQGHSTVHSTQVFSNISYAQSETTVVPSKQFSEIACSILRTLNNDNESTHCNPHGGCGSLKSKAKSAYNHNKPQHLPSSNSETSGKSKSSGHMGNTKEKATKYKSTPREPLIMNFPVKPPKIDVLNEDLDEISMSSNQTSVSVDHLPTELSSYSSGEVNATHL